MERPNFIKRTDIITLTCNDCGHEAEVQYKVYAPQISGNICSKCGSRDALMNGQENAFY